jgi:hypothetical protein
VLELDDKKRHGFRQCLLRIGEWERQAILSCLAVYFGAGDDAFGMIKAFGRRFDKLQGKPEIEGDLKGEGCGREIHDGAGWIYVFEIRLPMPDHFDASHAAPIPQSRSATRVLRVVPAITAPGAGGLFMVPITNRAVSAGDGA